MSFVSQEIIINRRCFLSVLHKMACEEGSVHSLFVLVFSDFINTWACLNATVRPEVTAVCVILGDLLFDTNIVEDLVTFILDRRISI